MSEPSVRKNYIYNLLLTIANLVFPLITYMHASRVLLPEGIGATSFANAVVSYFTMLASLGIPTYGIRITASVRNDKSLLSKTVQELLVINFCTAFISLLLLGLSASFVPRLIPFRMLILIYAFGLVFNILEIPWLYSGLEQYRYITLRSVLVRTLTTAAILIFIQKPKHTCLYAGITVSGFALTSLINQLHSRRYVSYKPEGELELKKHIRPICIFFLMSVATTIYLNLDNVMLGFMTNTMTVGIYATAVKIKTILAGIVTSMGIVLLPRMSALRSQSNEKSFWEYAGKSFHFSALISLPLTVFFILCAKESILIVSGDSFLSSIPAMCIIMPTIILIGFSNVTGFQVMIPRGMEHKVLISEIAGAVTDIILNACFIPKFGAAGAALGTLMAELVVLLIQLYFLKAYLQTILKGFGIISVLVSSSAAGTALYIVRGYILPDGAHMIISYAVYALVFGAVYLMGLILLKNRIASDCISYAVRILKKQRN